MSVVIRLRRGGSKKRPFYHVVSASKSCAVSGKFLEQLGYYNPRANEDVKQDDKTGVKKFHITDIERVKYWLSVGATPSDRVAVLLKKEYNLAEVEKFIPQYTKNEFTGVSKKDRKKKA